MQTLFFLLFCCAIGYVCFWVLVNEARGNKDGEWGFIAMRPTDPDATEKSAGNDGRPAGKPGWKP